MSDTILDIIIPCYNEEEVIPKTRELFLNELNALIKKNLVSDLSKIVFVDDGSKDSTWDIICESHNMDYHYTGIRLSKNEGHQNALLAGLMEVKDNCDVAISVDCDGQDDILAMEAMILEYKNGSEIVYGVRSNRDSDSFCKRFTAEIYYKLLKAMGIDIVFNHADYRLISSKALNVLCEYGEVNVFLRGIIPLLGFKSSCVGFKRKERLEGKSHYTLGKMISLAWNGITSFSLKPLHIATVTGVIVSIASLVLIIWALVRSITGNTISGWTSTMCVVCFIGGMQLLGIGILGEYLGKIYLEVKHRPRYHVMDRTKQNDGE